jgi:hypothetical protein
MPQAAQDTKDGDSLQECLVQTPDHDDHTDDHDMDEHKHYRRAGNLFLECIPYDCMP